MTVIPALSRNQLTNVAIAAIIFPRDYPWKLKR
jgi:hypothetical protein